MSIHISHTTRTYPKLPYGKIAAAILGAEYEISLTFLGETKAQQLNIESRNKDYIPNVLSFPLTDTVGEVYITPAVAKREASAAGMTYTTYTLFLFIHGCLHLKGYDHGTKMTALEKKYLKQFTR